MTPGKRPDLNERPANDNRTVDLSNLFDRNYRRPLSKPLDPKIRKSVRRVAIGIVLSLALIALLLMFARK